MAAPDELVPFVREALRLGHGRDEIAGTLRRAGWSKEQTEAALAAFADVPFAIPVPRPAPYLSAKEAFWYLVLFTALYLSAVNLGALLFNLIDLALPDPTDSEYAAVAARESIRWAIAILVVAFPLFVFMSRLVGRAVREDPAKRASKVRKWMTSLTLFVAVCILLGDGAALIYHLLSGALTSRFVLKALTVALLAGAVLGYYLRDLRRDDEEL
ncbi:MAG: DUF5671 domain-containing protein [Rubricoccaceae bacterium]|nr:DUF5671 domain-containing protein [Rubricoccaceae bacterium]